MKWITLVAMFVIKTGASGSLPTPASTLNYVPGTAYKYSYQFSVLLNEDSNITSRSASIGRDVGYKVSTDFLITNIWQNSVNIKENILKLELLKPKLHVSSTLHNVDGETKHWSKLDNLSYPPMYIHWDNGLIKSVYLLPDTESMTNIKKGLASIFQLHLSEKSTKESDVSGLCEVSYKVQGKSVKKSRKNCRFSKSKEQNYGANKLRSSTSSAISEMIYTVLPEGIIHSVSGTEKIMIKLNMWTQAAVFIKSKFKMVLIDQLANQPVFQEDSLALVIGDISKQMGLKIKGEHLEILPSDKPCFDNCQPLDVLIQEYGDYLHQENIGKLKSVSGFLKILDGFRRATKKELLIVFKNAKEHMLIPLMDVLAASNTEESLDVAFELIDFESDDISIPERFLLCLAVSANPSETAIRKTLKLSQMEFKSEKLRATVLVALSSMFRTYCQKNGENVKKKITASTLDVLLNGQRCDNPDCVLSHLYAMKNVGHPSFIPFILKCISTSGNIGFVALEALKAIDVKHFTPEVITTLYRVYNGFWQHEDTASRVLAVEILLQAEPSVDTVGKILMSLSDRDHPEVTTLVLATLLKTAERNHKLKLSLEHSLQNVSVGNYDNLAQNGSSTTYARLLQAAHDVNVTYGLNLEVRKTGMLKRTAMDLKFLNEEEEESLLSIGLFVNGFGLTDAELKAMEVPEENSVGMELSVLGIHLRPYTFFKGASEFMGLVWSGAGTELTPALQANFLLMDERKSVTLQNGIVVDFALKGATSADVSGAIEVSVWSKNANGVVRNSAALLIQGFCQVDTSFVESHVDFALGGNMVMLINLDYSHSPMHMCLQVDQPEFNFRHNVRKTETIPGSKHLIKTVKRRSIYFPGKSLALHKKNYDSCEAIHNPKQKSYW